MGMEKYNKARWRFTWKGRSTRCGNARVPVMGPCKDQRGEAGEGKCVNCSVSSVLEALIRLNFNKDVDVPTDILESDFKNFKGKVHKDNKVWHACDWLKATGALAFDSEGNEERYKLHSYHPLVMDNYDDLQWALDIYMMYGPMLGVFPVHDADMDRYGDTQQDEIYFVSWYIPNPKRNFHSVAIPGFGVTCTYPFWHFQNSYSSEWRGPARGYGQLFAPHLQELYGLRLR